MDMIATCPITGMIVIHAPIMFFGIFAQFVNFGITALTGHDRADIFHTMYTTIGMTTKNGIIVKIVRVVTFGGFQFNTVFPSIVTIGNISRVPFSISALATWTNQHARL